MINDFWNLLSNFWDSFKDKGLFNLIWSGYQETINNIRRLTYHTDLEKGVEEISADNFYKWGNFVLSDDNLVDGTSNEFKIQDKATIRIPKLQTRITDGGYSYYDGQDYTIDGNILKWISDPIPKDIVLWAEEVYYRDDSISSFYGELIGEKAQDSEEYINLVKGTMNSYWMGPEIRHIRNGINIILGKPYIMEDGKIAKQSSTSMTVVGKSGDTVYTKEETEEWAWAVGDEVKRFDLVIDTVMVLDYIKNPSWWEIYGLNIFQGGSVIPGDEGDLSFIARRFVWAIRIDGDLMSSLSSETELAILRFTGNMNPAYASHKVIIYNKFWGSNGDELDITDEWDEHPDGIIIDRSIDLSQTITFNEVSNLVYNDFQASNTSYDDYHSEEYRPYDLDNESLWFDDQLTVERI